MSNSAPILPPGSPLQRTRAERNPRLVVTVFAVLGLHVLLLSGLLIQGCKREDKTGNTSANPSTSYPETTPAPNPTTAEPSASAPVAAAPQNAADLSAEPRATLPPPMEPPVSTNVAAVPLQPATIQTNPLATAPRNTGWEGDSTVYSVKTGDTLTKIAKAHGTTVRALKAVNGLKVERIVVGQKLKVPAGKAGTSGGVPTPVSNTAQ